MLLYNLKERIPDEEYTLSLEEAKMVRGGEHVTVLTYSRMRYHVMQAAKTLVNKGYDPEVIDIRSLKPFDLYTIGNSVKKTHRVVIVEECVRTGGIGASLTAAINENFHDYLDASITDSVSVITGCAYFIFICWSWNIGGVDCCTACSDCS